MEDLQKINIISKEETYKNVFLNNTKIDMQLTKFEKAKVIGIRAQMIANGSESTILVPENITNSIDIAKLEFEQKKIPCLIRRYLTNKTYKDYRATDLY